MIVWNVNSNAQLQDSSHRQVLTQTTEHYSCASKAQLADAATMSEPSSSYADIPTSPEEVDSLPSSSAGSTTSVSPSEEEAYSDAEREWRESLQQLELMLTLVLIPYLGKYFGRKCAYWGIISSNFGAETIEMLTALQRMGKVHGMEVPCIGGDHQSRSFQRRWRH